MELYNDYLSATLRRLKSPEQMELNGRGLVFVILKGGEGTCHCGSLPHRLGSGSVLVVDRATGGKIQARAQGELVFWSFEAETEHLFPLFCGREICLLQRVVEVFKTGRVYPASSPLAKECLRLAEEVPTQFSLDHRSHLLRIVGAILTAEFKAAQPKLAEFVPMRDQVLRVFERLQTTELLSLPVGELAKKFNCSRRHLNRLFHQHIGVSVATLRMEMRLLKAVSLLLDPHAKITHVAEQCGFNHLGLFNTCFKKRFGSSPGQWRKATAGAMSRTAEQQDNRSPLLQSQGLSAPSEKSGPARKGNGQHRPLEQVALQGLLRDVAAARTGVNPPAFGRKEPDDFVFALGNKGDKRTCLSA